MVPAGTAVYGVHTSNKFVHIPGRCSFHEYSEHEFPSGIDSIKRVYCRALYSSSIIYTVLAV